MIYQPTRLGKIRERHPDEKIALVHGVFDLLHLGHVAHLTAARNLGVTVVGVCSDENVRARKGENRPINPLGTRMAVLTALKSVEHVFPLDGIGWPDELMQPHIELLEPDYYLLSSPNRQRPFGDQDVFEHRSGRVTELIYDKTYGTKEHSSTEIIRRLGLLESEG